MKKKYYSIHDMITIILKDDRTLPARNISLFEKDYNYFCKPNINQNEIDLTIEIGNFSPKKNCKIIEKDIYKLKKSYLFRESSYKIAKYRFEFSNFEKNETPILLRIHPNLPANRVIHMQIIDFVVYLLLNRNGYPALHASSVSKDGDAILFTGPGGSGKTSFSLFSLKNGFDFMGDDRIILNNGMVFGFPECVGFKRANSQYVANIIDKKSKMKLLINDLINRFSLGYIDGVYYLEAKNVFPQRIQDSSHLKTVVCLQPSKKFQISEIDTDTVINKFYANQIFENRRFQQHIDIYSTIYPDNELVEHHNIYMKNLKDNIPKNLEAYEVRLGPNDYNLVNEWLEKKIFW